MQLLENRKARQEFTILDKFVAGVMLSGAEVKSLRNKSGSFQGSFVKIVGNEAFLLNAQISPYKFADNREYDPKRTRKLLLKKRQILELSEALHQKGLTLVPLEFFTAGPFIKLTIGLAKGKKEYEKRSELRQRDIRRDVEKEMRGKVRIS